MIIFPFFGGYREMLELDVTIFPCILLKEIQYYLIIIITFIIIVIMMMMMMMMIIIIIIKPCTLLLSGLLLYNGQSTDGSGDFFSFGLSGGYAEFRYELGAGTTVIRTEEEVKLGRWHTANIRRNNTKGYLQVGRAHSRS